MNYQTIFCNIPTLIILLLFSACSVEQDQIYEKMTEKSFEDVLHDAEFAITENNFRVTTRLHIGSAIQKRGNSDFPKNEVLLFCNLTIAEEMLLIDPHYINFCPYKITVTESGQNIIIGTRLLPTRTNSEKMNKVAKDINKTLRSMVEYAASEDPFLIEFEDNGSN